MTDIIARLLDEIERLRAQLKTVLDRETATTARFDARIAEDYDKHALFPKSIAAAIRAAKEVK